MTQLPGPRPSAPPRPGPPGPRVPQQSQPTQQLPHGGFQPQPSGQSVASAPVPPQGAPAPAQPEPISPQPQRDVEPRRPEFVRFALPVSTTDEVPGRTVTGVIGLVIGIATRPRDMAHHPEMGYINTRARQDAIGALVQQAQEAGADAVVGVRFDGGKISETVTELAAYGTAVRLGEQPS